MSFQQEDFEYNDLFQENNFLKHVVTHYTYADYKSYILEDLQRFSKISNVEIRELSQQAEHYTPELVKYNHWGHKTNEIKMHESWRKLHETAASEGIVAIGYERKSAEFSRLHQFIKLMLFHPYSAFYSCPLAMTDGATKVLEQYKEKDPYFLNCFDHLTSRDPLEFWTSGQWMTEKAGGSDVSQSETYAVEKNGRYFLYGSKWFTSAITSDLAMALAQTSKGVKKSLSLFLIKIRDEDQHLNKIEVLRLKDKLGTKAMPTAELNLDGTEAHLIGAKKQGVKEVATILNISRLYNSVCATGSILRLLSLSKDYAKKRWSFGVRLEDHPLHAHTLLEQEAKTQACVHLVTSLSVLLGQQECHKSSKEADHLLRLLIPIAKLWTAKKSIEVTSELLESFGGAGYIEDTGLPKFLRDVQVFSIWEGTTNILSLDVLRVLSKTESLDSIYSKIKTDLLNIIGFEEEKKHCIDVLDIVTSWFKNCSSAEQMQIGSREFSFKIAEVYSALKMMEFANETKEPSYKKLCSTFVKKCSLPVF